MLRGVFGKTLWENRLTALWWVLGSAVLTAVLVAFYPTIRDSPAMREFLEQFPSALLVALGIDPETFQTGSGYVRSELYSLVAPLIVIAFALSVGAASTAAEEEKGTMDQLLSLPLERGRLVIEKLAAQLILLAALVSSFVAVLFLGNYLVDLQLSTRGILSLNLGLLLLGFLFGSFAAAVGAWQGRTSWAQGAGAGLAIATFFLYGFAPLVPALAGVGRFTPYYWYVGSDPLLNGPSLYFVLLAVGCGVFTAGTVFAFRRRDIATTQPIIDRRSARRTERRPSPMLATAFGQAIWERRRSIWGWMAGLALLAAMISAFYPTIRSGSQDGIQELLESIPAELLALFGITDPGSLLTGAGLVSSRVYSSIGLIMVLTFAIGTGTAVLAGEDHGGTADLLLSNPLTRPRVVAEKFLAMVALVGVLVVGLFMAVLVGDAVIDLELTLEGMVAANLGLGLIGVLFGSVALGVGAWQGRPGLASGAAGGLAVATFFLNGLGATVDLLEPFRALSPFFWYLGDSTPLATGFSATFVLLAVATAACFGTAVVLFRRRDIGT